MRHHTMRHSCGGFSLIELLVVLSIIALLSAVAGPQFIKHLGRAKSDAARLQIQDLGAALDLYYLDNGRYPDTGQGLNALVQAPPDTPAWQGPYLKKQAIPKDPWGNAYHYRAPGEHGLYDLYSHGADNRSGGKGEAGDVLSWE